MGDVPVVIQDSVKNSACTYFATSSDGATVMRPQAPIINTASMKFPKASNPFDPSQPAARNQVTAAQVAERCQMKTTHRMIKVRSKEIAIEDC